VRKWTKREKENFDTLSEECENAYANDNQKTDIVFVCKSHYIHCFIKELGIDNSLGSPTYIPTTLTKEEILDNHWSILWSIDISTKDEELDLPSLLNS